MNEITKVTLGQFVVTGEFDIAASVSADAESKKAGDSVNVILRFKMSQTPLSEIIHSSLKDKRINWQTKGRTKTETLKPNQVIVLDYKGGRSPVVPITLESAKGFVASLSETEREEFIAQLKGIK